MHARQHKHAAQRLIILGGGSAVAIEPPQEISNNVVCASSKAPDKPAHTRSLIRAFDNRLNFLSSRGGCTGSSESSLVRKSHCWKSHVAAHIIDVQI